MKQTSLYTSVSERVLSLNADSRCDPTCAESTNVTKLLIPADTCVWPVLNGCAVLMHVNIDDVIRSDVCCVGLW